MLYIFIGAIALAIGIHSYLQHRATGASQVQAESDAVGDVMDALTRFAIGYVVCMVVLIAAVCIAVFVFGAGSQ